ncbi:hypothetical protein [Halalkalibacter oceani]|uniref:hypothetical protein n=1 Tax=Halalkalibacter oceani TaxID=1653776 RepID=UPI00339810F4
MAFHKDLRGEDLHFSRILVGTVSPVGFVKPDIDGEIYYDLSTRSLYISTGTNTDDWSVDKVGLLNQLTTSQKASIVLAINELKTTTDNKLDSVQFIEHANNNEIHVTQEKQDYWDSKAEGVHTHTESDIVDLDKYTRLETDSLLNEKANLIHVHKEEDITDLDKYSRQEVDDFLHDKANLVHTHVEADILDLDKYTVKEVDDLLQQVYDLIGDFNDITQMEYDDFHNLVDAINHALELSRNAAPLLHTHLESDITDLDKYSREETDELLNELRTEVSNRTSWEEFHL